MATAMSKTLQPSNSSATLFRAWANFILDAFLAGGWVQTADTGQVDTTTMSAPGGGNTKVGYVILRMDDALQATVPIYLKLYFGSGGGTNDPAIWVTLGGGTDGAGVVTSPTYFGEQRLNSGSNNTAQAPCYSYASVDTNRCVFAMFVPPTSGSFAIAFSIERGKTQSGGDSDNLIIHWSNSGSSSLDRSNYAITGQFLQPPTETAQSFVLSVRNPTAAADEVGIGTLFTFAGQAKAPGTSWVVGQSGDWNTLSRIVVSMYGETITYQGLGTGFRTGAVSSNLLFIRYD